MGGPAALDVPRSEDEDEPPSDAHAVPDRIEDMLPLKFLGAGATARL